MPSTLTPVVRNSDETEKRWFYGGGLHAWLVRERESGDGFLLFEDTVDPGKSTPLHVHARADETFYLLDGSMVLHIDGAEHELRTGGVAMVPRGVPHAFQAQAAGARMLCLHTPGGGEDFYRSASEPVVPGEPALAVDFNRIRQAAEATGSMTIVGPPPF
jgi:quercetin dioxygenase-like cupin family protein